MIIWGNWEIRVFPRNPILDVQMWGYVEVTCGLWEGQELPRRSCLPTPEQFFYWNICQTAEFNCFGIFSNLSFSCRRLPAPSLVAPIYLQHNSLSYFTMSESENSSVQLGKMSIAHWLGSLGKRQVTSAAPSSFTFSSSCHRILQETSIGLFRWGPAHQKVPSSPWDGHHSARRGGGWGRTHIILLKDISTIIIFPVPACSVVHKRLWLEGPCPTLDIALAFYHFIRVGG